MTVIHGWVAPSRRRATGTGVVAVAVAVAGIVLAALLAGAPFLATGVVVGTLFGALVVARPLLTVAILLAIGNVDLSFVTGGFKNLFPQLGGLDMNGIRLLVVVGGLALVALTDPRVGRRVIGPWGRWYLAFLLLAAGSLAMSLSPLDGLRLLLKLAYPFLIFVTVLGLADEPRQLSRLVDITLIAAAIIVIGINPVYALAGGYEKDLYGNIRYGGVGFHENPFSFFLVVMLLLAFARFSNRRQLRYLVLSLGFGIWIVLTLTRITFLASLTGLFGIALYSAVVQRNYRVVAAAAFVGAVVAVPLVPVVLERTFYGRIPSMGELVVLLSNPVALYHAVNWQGREFFWAFLAQSFVASPVLGNGIGSSTALLRSNFPGSAGLVAHNEYLRLLVDVGLVGVAIFFVAIIKWLWGAVRAGRWDRPYVRELAMPAAAVVVAWAFISATDNPFDYYAPFTQYAGFLCAGAIAASEMAAREDPDAHPQADADSAPAEGVTPW